MKAGDIDYTSAFYGGFSDDELALWRHLRDQGGYWITEELLPLYPKLGGSHRMGGLLKRLFSGNHVARRMGPGRVWTYGVTTTCRPPMRETMTINTAALTEAS